MVQVDINLQQLITEPALRKQIWAIEVIITLWNPIAYDKLTTVPTADIQSGLLLQTHDAIRLLVFTNPDYKLCIE